MSKSIKILVGYHKPSYLFKDEMFTPVHAGRAVSGVVAKDGTLNDKEAGWLLDNTVGDNSGDNISTKNREYCECTALYWAWKNYKELGDPDYIGFMQYRRQFILKEGLFEGKELDEYERAYATRKMLYPCKDYEQFLGIDKENLSRVLDTCGGIYTNPCDLSLVNITNLRDDYGIKIPGVNVDDFDLMMDVVTKMYPDMADFIRARAAQPLKSCFQMWVLPKKIFFEYMEFLFSVLFECEKHVDVTAYSVNGKRTMGYLAELLCDFYMNFYKEKYNLKGADVCLIERNIPQEELSPSMLTSYRMKYLKYKIAYLLMPEVKPLRDLKNKYRDRIKAIKAMK